MRAVRTFFPCIISWAVIPSLYKKICLLGDFAVGKTSLVRRYVDNQFSDQYLTTIGVKISRKLVTLEREGGDVCRIQMILWDLEGRENFTGDSRSYLKGASGAVVVADVCRSNTMNNVSRHVEAFLAENPTAHVVVACNKGDLLSDSTSAGLSEINNAGVLHTLITSAREGTGVNELFTMLGREMARTA